MDALRSAHQELLELKASPLSPAGEIAAAKSPDNKHRRQVSRLAFLAPDLQRQILAGEHPRSLKLRTLLKNELPLAWADQRAWFAQLQGA